MTKNEFLLHIMNKPAPQTRNLKPRPLETKVEYKPNGCWIWKGELSYWGVPKDGEHSARRVIYDQYIRPVGNNEIVVCACKDARCVSPYHAGVIKFRDV
jgi:hypothetical protein